MKKFLGIILAVMMLATVAFAADITVTLNGEAIDFADQAPEIVDGRTLVPLRAIFEALGASVEWDQATKTVTSSMDDVTIKLTIGENTLYRNGEAKTLDVAAQILNGRTMVPARAIAEAYGVGVEWDAATRTVVLTQEVKAAEEELDENTFFVLTGENYTGAEGYQFTSGVTIQPEIVADFEDADNKVLFLHSTFTEKQSWSYFRDYAHVKFAPGERYLVKFRVSPEYDSADNSVPLPSFGICFRYADTAEDGSYKDHGVYTAKGEFGKWTEVCFIFTIPETLDASKGSGFGIFANPSNNLPVSFYLDDVSVSIYDGPASDGAQSPESIKAAEAKKSFSFDDAKGILFDYDDSFDLSQASASEKFIENGNLVMVAAENFPDPQVYYRDVSYAAAEYDAIAVRFKAENANINDNAKAKTFQIYYTTDSDDKLSESKSSSASFDECIKDGDWYVAYIVMAGNENWKGNITLLRLDPANDAGTFTIDKFVLIEA